MGTKSRETIYGSSVRAAAERATEARKEADRLAVEAWNKRMLGFQGPAQQSPALGDAINAGFGYLEVKCLGCNTVVRNTDAGSEMVLMRWGMPPPPRTGGLPVTNIRNTSSPRWRGWLKLENRCLIPANSFAEYAPDRDGLA